MPTSNLIPGARKHATLLRRGWHSFLHGRCRLCAAPADTTGLCPACRAELPTNRAPCPGCGEPGIGPARCSRCLRSPPAFQAIHAPWRYAWPLDRLIRAMKFRGDLAAARTLGELLAQELDPATVDAVIPVPLHGGRLRQRGYNQALELARPLCRGEGPELWPTIVQRHRATRAQAELAMAERRANVRQAFSLPEGAAQRIAGRRLAVVDDVVTTAETANALAALLLDAGAKRVTVWAMARAEAPARD